MTATAGAANPEAGPIEFNPLSPDFIRDPYPFYHRLRAAAPMFRTRFGRWLASRYDDVATALRDKRFGKDFEGRMTRRHGPRILDEPVYEGMRHRMAQMDPPDHTRLRGLVVKAFTARTVEDMRPRIREIVAATLDRVTPRRQMDVMRDFAHQLPVTVICDMLGIPDADRDLFLGNRGEGARMHDPVPMTRPELDAINEGYLAQVAYFRSLFELRRREPGTDLTTLLVQAEDKGNKLSEAELTANILLLFGAGHETTSNLIGNGLLALHRHPDQLALLKRERSLMPNAIDELLRYDTSVQLSVRTALEDVELGGVAIARGEEVFCLLGAANRDPAAFPEPDRLDITRANIRPLSFGGGIHFCLGAQLGRIQAEIALDALLTRLPDLRLDAPENPAWRQTFVGRGLTALPARW